MVTDRKQDVKYVIADSYDMCVEKIQSLHGKNYQILRKKVVKTGGIFGLFTRDALEIAYVITPENNYSKYHNISMQSAYEFNNTSISKLIIDSEEIIGVNTNSGDYNLSGLFINIGYEPSINIVKNLDIELDRNYIIVDKNMETNLKGIYACGDIIKKDLYQLVTAVSDGAIAANHIYKNVKNN